MSELFDDLKDIPIATEAGKPNHPVIRDLTVDSLTAFIVWFEERGLTDSVVAFRCGPQSFVDLERELMTSAVYRGSSKPGLGAGVLRFNGWLIYMDPRAEEVEPVMESEVEDKVRIWKEAGWSEEADDDGK